jgi:UDP-2,4-diacetamido-2,4,6-trideoxy-beta-L-altropyranose hydrolase
MADGAQLYDWQRHPETRRYFRNPKPPEEQAHWAWLRSKLADADTALMIAEQGDQPVGMLRLDRQENGLEISVVTAPRHYGKGVARMALAIAARAWPDAPLLAEVMTENAASQALFRSAGFKEESPGQWRLAPRHAGHALRGLIFIDGGAGVGLGHSNRCLGLTAGLIRRGCDMTVATPVDPDFQAYVAKLGFPPIALDDANEALVALVTDLRPDLVIVDSYRVDLTRLRGAMNGAALIAFDDYVRQPLEADIVINGSPSSETLAYPAGPLKLLGPVYQILRPDLQPREGLADTVRHLIVLLGGGDPMGIAPALVKLLTERILPHHPDLEAELIIGPFSPAPDCTPGRLTVTKAPADLPARMRNADLALSAGGQTLLELALLGVPTIAVGTSPDQKPNLKALSEAGVVRWIGWGNEDAFAQNAEEALNVLMRDKEERAKLARNASSLLDGFGGERAAGAVCTHAHLRKAA